MTATDKKKIALIGGNGFAGTHIAEQLVKQGAAVISYSRKGTRPVHLQNARWASDVEWRKGDGRDAAASWFDGVDAVVALVGAPPVPTISKQAFEQQLMTNSAPNCAAIEAAGDAGVNRLVLMGAAIPRLLQRKSFGYHVGKQRCLEAARQFAAKTPANTAIVLQPASMYGTRHTAGGKPIPLSLVMAPLSVLLPGFFVSIEQVAGCAADAALGLTFNQPGLEVVGNRALRQYRGATRA